MRKSKLIKSDPTLKNNLMVFGYDSEVGWERLLDECVEELEKESERCDFDFEISQIKEKYGTARIYLSSENDSLSNIVCRYEILSSHICEHCGEFYTAKNRKSHGWWKTLCNKCAEEFNWC